MFRNQPLAAAPAGEGATTETYGYNYLNVLSS